MDSVAVVEVDHGQAVILDLNMSLENVTDCFKEVLLHYFQGDLATLSKARKRICQHSLQILPPATCLPPARVDSR